jgi:hypothetical protein
MAITIPGIDRSAYTGSKSIQRVPQGSCPSGVASLRGRVPQGSRPSGVASQLLTLSEVETRPFIPFLLTMADTKQTNLSQQPTDKKQLNSDLG